MSSEFRFMNSVAFGKLKLNDSSLNNYPMTKSIANNLGITTANKSITKTLDEILDDRAPSATVGHKAIVLVACQVKQRRPDTPAARLCSSASHRPCRSAERAADDANAVLVQDADRCVAHGAKLEATAKAQALGET